MLRWVVVNKLLLLLEDDNSLCTAGQGKTLDRPRQSCTERRRRRRFVEEEFDPTYQSVHSKWDKSVVVGGKASSTFWLSSEATVGVDDGASSSPLFRSTTAVAFKRSWSSSSYFFMLSTASCVQSTTPHHSNTTTSPLEMGAKGRPGDRLRE